MHAWYNEMMVWYSVLVIYNEVMVTVLVAVLQLDLCVDVEKIAR